ncbi:MAG: T9SS type A sorting domain-containing protein, partial [Bacteroidetes bacterium]|nr:T9SS type A sorting domain-containing protein [Bacteroidota bacterium]
NTKIVIDTFNITVNAVDDAPFVSNPIADITADEDATIAAISLANVFGDIDNDDATITKAIISANDESLLSMNISEDMLNVILQDNQSGELEIVIEASSNTKTVTDTFNITVNAVNDPPIVSNSIADQTIDMNSNNIEIDLSEIFVDIDGDELILTVDNNTNTDLVTSQIENFKLTLQFIQNQYGEAVITIKANDGTESITTSFNVIVNNTTGINYINEYQLETYPNPTSSYLNITSPEKIKEIVVMNTNGVLQQVLNVNNTEKNYQIDLRNLPTGIYFVTIILEDSRITKKVIKQ